MNNVINFLIGLAVLTTIFGIGAGVALLLSSLNVFALPVFLAFVILGCLAPLITAMGADFKKNVIEGKEL